MGDDELAEGDAVAVGAGVGEADLGRLTKLMLGGRSSARRAGQGSVKQILCSAWWRR